MNQIQLLHGDCFDHLQNIDNSSIDLVVTSPPYNLGINYSTYKDKDSREDFLAWCQKWTEQIYRVLKEDGSFFLNIGAAPKNPLLPYQLLLELTNPDKTTAFHLQNTFHWVKSISVQTRDGQTISAGHFKPINSKRFVNDCHEFIFHLTKSNKVELDRKAAGVPYVYKSNIGRWGHTDGMDKRCRGNTWFIPYDTIKNRSAERPHPATFPVELAQRCILIHGKNKVQHMIDPFVGIGSSALAAQAENIPNFTGIDVDETYLEIAQERLDQRSDDLFAKNSEDAN